MSRYTVMVDDNFHYMDGSERWELGTFVTAEGALAACRKIVDDWLAHNYKPGMTADQLYEHYTSFGEEPFVVAPAGGAKPATFSARDYVRERAAGLCGGAVALPDTFGTSR
jgi:hypothetical protein